MSTPGSSDTPPRRVQHAVSHSAPGAERGRDHLRRQDDAVPRCWCSRRVQGRKHGRCLRQRFGASSAAWRPAAWCRPRLPLVRRETYRPRLQKRQRRRRALISFSHSPRSRPSRRRLHVLGLQCLLRALHEAEAAAACTGQLRHPHDQHPVEDAGRGRHPRVRIDHTRPLDVAVLRMVKSPPAAMGEGTAATHRLSSVFGRPAGSVAGRGPPHGRRPWSPRRAV